MGGDKILGDKLGGAMAYIHNILFVYTTKWKKMDLKDVSEVDLP